MEKLYRLALVRPLGKFVPVKWDDWPEMCTIIQAGQQLVSKEYAIGYCYNRNSRLRAAGRRTCVVVIPAGQRAKAGDICDRGVPLYDVA